MQAPCQPKSGGHVQAHIVVPGPLGDDAFETPVAPLLPKQGEPEIKAGSSKGKPQENVAGN